MRQRRRFELLDAMILVAAAGLATSLVRHYLDGLSALGGLNGGRYLPAIWLRWFQGAVPVLGVACLALLVCRLRRPRPPRRQLWALPGTTASIAVAIAIPQLIGEAIYAAWKAPGRGGPYTNQFNFVLQLLELRFFELSEFVGFPVAIYWSILALGGRWRSESSWIDRLGRIYGCTWIALFLIFRWSNAEHW
jgi:hypothetical protein